MIRIGVTFGCYIPLHLGHARLIAKALQENNQVIIGVCGKDNDRGKDFLDFRTRIKLMKDKFKDDPRVIVVAVDDEKIHMDGTFTLENWKVWCKELFDQAGIDPYDDWNRFTWYMGEESYKEKISQIYPRHEFCRLNRKPVTDEEKARKDIVELSGTRIRNNPEQFSGFIDPDFLEYLREKHKI